MLKRLLFSLSIILTSVQLNAQHDGPINWVSLEEADSLYAINPKPLFIDVYTDWCGWCKRMDATTFKNQQIANYLNTYFYAVKLDAETDEDITFQGRNYQNTQKEKVKVILDSLNNGITLLQDSIKERQAFIDGEKTEVSAKLNEVKRVEAIRKKAFDEDASKFNKLFKKSLKNEGFEKTIQNKYKNLSPSEVGTQIKKEIEELEAQINNLANDELLANGRQRLKTQSYQLKSFAKRARKTTHDVAIDLCQGQMSYPTFIMLFADSLKANLPLKGFKQVDDLFAYLSFVNEGVYNATRDVNSYVNTCKEVTATDYNAPKDLVKWESFEGAITAAKKDGKKIFVHVIHPNSVTSKIMDNKNLRKPEVTNKINKNFHPVKLYLNDQNTISYKGKDYAFENGVHQLALLLMNNNFRFPHFAFLNEEGNLVMNVPQYFEGDKMLPVLDYFNESGYLQAPFQEWLKNREK